MVVVVVWLSGGGRLGVVGGGGFGFGSNCCIFTDTREIGETSYVLI